MRAVRTKVMITILAVVMLSAAAYYLVYPHKNAVAFATARRLCQEEQLVEIVDPAVWRHIAAASTEDLHRDPDRYGLRTGPFRIERVDGVERARIQVFEATNGGRLVLRVRNPIALARSPLTDLGLFPNFPVFSCLDVTPSRARTILFGR